MKQTKHFRRLMSLLLVAAMLLSMTVVGLVGVSAAEDGPTLTYSFKYDNAGYAEGRVRLTASSELDYDKYTLYWANDTEALEGYAPITTINLNQESRSFTFGKHTAIPAGATKLIAVESALAVAPVTVDKADAVYDIPESKQFKYAPSDKEYTFQTLSDIHFHRDGYEAYQYADEHLTSALNAAELRGAEFVATCGDNTNYGDVKEWGQYLATIANSNFTGHIYEVNGNHEPYNEALGSDAHKNILEQYKVATGLDTETGKMRSELYYEITSANGDHHIFMALELVNKDNSPKISDNFSPEQMDWLEGLLNKYKNDGKKIFIYEHAPFTSYGAGDNKVNPHYTAAMTIDEATYPQTYRFKELLEDNKNIVWFSGHTHLDFKYNYNFDNENGTTAYTVHVPSTASTTTVNAADNGLIYEAKADSAQGYFVDVYADATVLNGTDLVKNEILPLYTYLVDYSGDKLIENEVEGGEEVNYTKVVVTVDASVFDAKSVKVALYGADDETLTQFVTMIKDTDGLFKANVSTQFTKMKFSVTTDKFTISSAEFAVADATVKLGAYKVAFDNTYDWANVNVYAWNTAGGELAAWPGIAMDKQADGTYTAIIPDFPNMIIFNNGSGQTDDLDIAPYIKETIAGSYTPNSTPTPPVEDVPEEPVVPAETVEVYFEKPDSWKNAYIYGFYGVVGQTAEAVWPADYPGKPMTLVEGNTYKYDVPVDIDYIKFCDGDNKGTNYRTDNIPGSNIAEGVTFGITGQGSKYWDWTVSKAGVASVGAGTTVYAINSAKWDTVCAYYWGGADVAWPGTAMTKTGEKVNGFDVYSITLDTAPQNIIFNNNNNGSQTADLTFQAGQYYDVKAGQWYKSLSEVPAVDTLSTDRYLVGAFNNWSTVADEFKLKAEGDKVGYVELELEAYTTYEFKIVREGTWTSCKETLQITETGSGFTFSSSVSSNTKITTRDAGKYVFAFGIDTSQLSVTYPTAVVPTTPATTAPATTAAPVTTPATSTPATTAAPVTTPDTTEIPKPEVTTAPITTPATTVAPEEPETIKIYFTNNKGWKNAYIYGFYGEIGQTAEAVWPEEYPGAEMTYVRTNSMGQDIYCYDVPVDIDYIKFCDGDSKGTNNRTDNIPNAEFTGENNGFYLEDKGSKYWPYVGYKYIEETPVEPTTTVIVTEVPSITETTAAATSTAAATTAPVTTPGTTVADEVDTIKVYFTNNKGWKNAYIYGFYGEVGQTAEAVWPKDYPGAEMTYVRTNSMGQDIYCYDVPADIDYIKFCDGDANGTNNRTDNIANAEFTGENNAFYLKDKGSKYWPYVAYKYIEETPVEPTTTAIVTEAPSTAETTAAATSTAAVTTAPASSTAVTTTAAAPTEPESSVVFTTALVPTSAPVSSTPVVEPITLKYGDADLNDIVNIKDATAIQKHIASLITLSEQGYMVADVDANDNVNIKDATAIQKKIADVIKEFPSGEFLVIGTPEVPTTAPVTKPSESTEPSTAPTTVPTTTIPSEPPVPDTELTKLLETVKKTLADETYYASYNAYADLKKVYFEYKDANVAEADAAAAIAEINTAKTAYETMKKNNPNHINYQAPKPGSYLLRGTMNNWDESGVMSADGNGVSITYNLAAGEHMLKIYDVDTGKWYGNGGTFTDTCSGWTMTDTAGDLKFTTTGGTYKFFVLFDGGKVKLTVTKQ